MSDDDQEFYTIPIHRVREDQWYLDALPVGALAEVDGRTYRKDRAGQWIVTAETIADPESLNSEAGQ